MVKELAEKPPITPLRIIACSRRPPPNTSIQSASDANVEWHKLDIGDNLSVSSFAAAMKEKCPGGIDVLINNAGVNLDQTEGHGLQQAKTTVGINYEGTLNMMKTFVPLMRRPGIGELGSSRIVNVSSVGGKIVWAGTDDLRQSFKTASSLRSVDALRDTYLEAVSRGTEERGGWPKGKSYCVSKSLINASSEVIADENKDLLINFCCPGWVSARHSLAAVPIAHLCLWNSLGQDQKLTVA